jgi:hypothetical protein
MRPDRPALGRGGWPETPVDKQQKVRPWWRTDAAGNVVMSVHFGTKAIEFEKGKQRRRGLLR